MQRARPTGLKRTDAMNEALQKLYSERIMTAAEAVQCVKSGDTVYVGTASSTPLALLDALGDRERELEQVCLTASGIPISAKVASGKTGAFISCTYFMDPMCSIL